MYSKKKNWREVKLFLIQHKLFMETVVLSFHMKTMFLVSLLPFVLYASFIYVIRIYLHIHNTIVSNTIPILDYVGRLWLTEYLCHRWPRICSDPFLIHEFSPGLQQEQHGGCLRWAETACPSWPQSTRVNPGNLVGIVLLNLWFFVQCFVDRCLSFFFWSLCCLSFFDLWLLIMPLVSSNLCH